VTAALIGAVAVALAGLFAGIAGLLSGRGPAHLADVTGLSALVDQLQEERVRAETDRDKALAQRDNALAQLRECQAEAARLRGENR
jgi:hypothetical protein